MFRITIHLDDKHNTLCSVQEFSDLCGRNRDWTYKRIRSGSLEHQQVSGVYLIPVREVARVLAERVGPIKVAFEYKEEK